MRELGIEIVATGDVRRSLTVEGDVRSDVAFQNDVNALLARIEQMAVPWRPLFDLTGAVPVRGVVAETTPMPSLRGEARRTFTLDRIGLAPLVVANPPAVSVDRRARRAR